MIPKFSKRVKVTKVVSPDITIGELLRMFPDSVGVSIGRDINDIHVLRGIVVTEKYKIIRR